MLHAQPIPRPIWSTGFAQCWKTLTFISQSPCPSSPWIRFCRCEAVNDHARTHTHTHTHTHKHTHTLTNTPNTHTHTHTHTPNTHTHTHTHSPTHQTHTHTHTPNTHTLSLQYLTHWEENAHHLVSKKQRENEHPVAMAGGLQYCAYRITTEIGKLSSLMVRSFAWFNFSAFVRQYHTHVHAQHCIWGEALRAWNDRHTLLTCLFDTQLHTHVLALNIVYLICTPLLALTARAVLLVPLFFGW